LEARPFTPRRSIGRLRAAISLAESYGARPGLPSVWPPRHSRDPRMVLACLRIKGASSGKQNREPGCETSLVRR